MAPQAPLEQAPCPPGTQKETLTFSLRPGLTTFPAVSLSRGPQSMNTSALPRASHHLGPAQTPREAPGPQCVRASIHKGIVTGDLDITDIVLLKSPMPLDIKVFDLNLDCVFYICIYIYIYIFFIYLFCCAGSYLQHAGSLVAACGI